MNRPRRAYTLPKGFSLVELLSALAVSALVLTFALGAFVDFVKVERRYRDISADERNARAVRAALEADVVFAGIGLPTGDEGLGGGAQAARVVDGGVDMIGAFPNRPSTRPRVAWWLDVASLERDCTERQEEGCHSYRVAIRVPGESVASEIEGCEDAECAWREIPLGDDVVLATRERPLGVEAKVVRTVAPDVDSEMRIWVVVETPADLGRPDAGATIATLSRVEYRLNGTTLRRRECGAGQDLEQVREADAASCGPAQEVARDLEAIAFELVTFDDAGALAWRLSSSFGTSAGALRIAEGGR